MDITQMPKISVLMPIYNTNNEYLKESINSILNQTYNDFEFLILDDCPENLENQKIIESFQKKDPRIKYFRNVSNLGISKSRNILLDKACGKYIAVMDHDDISLPNRFYEQITFLDNHPDYGVCGCQIYLLKENKISYRPVEDHEIKKLLCNTLICPIHHPAVMIRTELLRKYNISYEESFSPAEDYALWLRLSKVTKFYNLKECFFEYRNYDNTTSKNPDIFQNLLAKAQFVINNKYFRIGKERKKHIEFSIDDGRKKVRVDFGFIKFTFKLKKINLKKYLDFLLHSTVLVNKDNSRFYSFKYYPVNSFDLNAHSFYNYHNFKVGIVVQGEILNDYNFTLNTLHIYKKIFPNNSELILSTWEKNDDHNYKSLILEIKRMGVHVLLNKKPSEPGVANSNMQIRSTLNGLMLAKKLGCLYVIKSRTDQRIYSDKCLPGFYHLIKHFKPLDNKLNSRIVICSFNTFKYRYYGISDMFMFGNIDDVILYWNVREQSYDPFPLSESKFENFQKKCIETFICFDFQKKLNLNLNFNLLDYYNLLEKYFIVVDRDFVEIYWPKYSSNENRFRNFYFNDMEELSFSDWLRLLFDKNYKIKLAEYGEQLFRLHDK